MPTKLFIRTPDGKKQEVVWYGDQAPTNEDFLAFFRQYAPPKAVPTSGIVNGPYHEPKTQTAQRNMSLAKQLAMRYGWHDGAEWAALKHLWSRESKWDHNAANPVSTARGIPQAIMSVHFGKDWKNDPKAHEFLSNPQKQIEWGLDYIRRRYKKPTGALAFWYSKKPKNTYQGHWY